MTGALAGAPSDGTPDVLATGAGGADLAFVSASATDPAGRDSTYLEWHTYDHRPEQHRLAQLRASLRLLSRPSYRAARIASHGEYDRVEHVMAYFFTSAAGLGPFNDLFQALDRSGRMPFLLPPVDRGAYERSGSVAASRLKVGADVLPWWPARGVFLLLERAGGLVNDLVSVPGVAGVWTGTSAPAVVPDSMRAEPARQGQTRITFCYLDDDPLAVATRLRPALEARWTDGDAVPLLAGPFATVTDRRDWQPEADA
jgi:hypothetical protein